MMLSLVHTVCLNAITNADTFFVNKLSGNGAQNNFAPQWKLMESKKNNWKTLDPTESKWGSNSIWPH